MFKKYKQLFAGIVIGSVIAGTSATLADSSVSAILSSSIKFKFDGAEKQLPDGYSVLMYNDHTYVPARFVAEALGAKVDWDGSTNSVIITSSNGASQSGSTSSSKGNIVGNYTFSNYSLDNSGIATKVIGEITNNSTSAHNVNFTINFYDSNKKLLGSAGGSVLNLQPGQKKSFEAYADNVLQGISVYSFQIDGEW